MLFRGEPMEVMARVLEAQSVLCDQLEAVADSLPNAVDSETCFRLAAVMKVLVTEAHRFKEAVVYPLFEARFADRIEMPAIIARLRSEHAEDETYAQELAEALTAGRRNMVENPEAMGYMLRAFFRGLRRQVAFEREQLGAYVALQ
ncbi:hypothetical protein ATN84_20790 [Paramesorhizobium deserti]|uniref:Hemerythrin-like domain-containing protein n=1 Tax=Paramesorhizobium deserti TaxID=1494590 RepID=A0A135HPH0_9HYPH|nr:hemerythrin domain-containing protein [Paramesorhizobium deserti]KXF75117.1 hypothetical protein ATN84_20790 [Paramesorhizobium deserti]